MSRYYNPLQVMVTLIFVLDIYPSTKRYVQVKLKSHKLLKRVRKIKSFYRYSL